MRLKEVIKVVRFPLWINETISRDTHEATYYETLDDLLLHTSSETGRKEVKYITTDGNGEVTIEV